MTTLFVTGGAGFIGSNFVRYWLETHPGDRVVNYDALTYAGVKENLDDLPPESRARYTFVQGNILDGDLALDTLRSMNVDTIVNFAAESHNSYAIKNPTQFFKVNVLGTQTLLEAARQAGNIRFHHISTCEVYGDLALDTDEKFTEESPYRPRTPYNASKAGADMAVRAYHETFHLPVTISNCANNYGPYQFPEKVLPYFTVQALQGQQLPLYKSSQNRREWLHAVDHCRAIDLILSKGRIGETYNVGSGVEVDVEGIAKIVLETLGLDESFKKYVPDRPGHDRRYLLDSSKLRHELGWAPQVPVDQGLRDTVLWYKAHPEWWKPLMGRSPVDEQKGFGDQGSK